jgi:hypothetical protein
MKTAISPSRQPKTETSANPIDFLDEDLVLVPASGIPEEFRKLSREAGDGWFKARRQMDRKA